MDEDARELVRRLLNEGQRYDDVRRAIISHGYSTEGFETEYNEIQKELGIKEPPPTLATPQVSTNVLQDGARQFTAPQRELNITVLVSNVAKILAGVLVIVVAAIVLSGYGTVLKEKIFGSNTFEDEGGLNAGDYAYEAQLRTLQASAQSFRARLLDYGGACNDIGVDREVFTCTDSPEWFVIETQLSNGSFYCADNTGFVGIIHTSSREKTSCQP